MTKQYIGLDAGHLVNVTYNTVISQRILNCDVWIVFSQRIYPIGMERQIRTHIAQLLIIIGRKNIKHCHNRANKSDSLQRSAINHLNGSGRKTVQGFKHFFSYMCIHGFSAQISGAKIYGGLSDMFNVSTYRDLVQIHSHSRIKKYRKQNKRKSIAQV